MSKTKKENDFQEIKKDYKVKSIYDIDTKEITDEKELSEIEEEINLLSVISFLLWY